MNKKNIILIFIISLFLFGCTHISQNPTNNTNNSQLNNGSLTSDNNLGIQEDYNSISGAFPSDENLFVYLIDIGQGDSILIITPNHESILIDTGKKSQADKVWNFLIDKNATHLTYLVGTHPDADHIGGISPLVSKGLVFEHFLGSYFSCGTSTCEEYRALVYPKRVKYYKSGDYLNLSVPVKILNPDINFYLATKNDNSVTLYLLFGNIKMFFTGDCQDNCERRIMQNFQNIKAEILKVAHHGSNYSTSDNFLNRVKPEVGLISVGVNNYRHPHPDLLKRLKKHNVNVYRTDLNGTITVTTDGINYSILTEKSS